MMRFKDRFRIVPAVYLVLRDGDKVLLLERANTGYHDGEYSFPGGHVGGADETGGEPARMAAVREAKEELDIDIDPKDLRLVHTMHRYSSEPEPHERVDFGFAATKWRGIPTNAEPHKSAGIKWFPITKLPENLIPEIRFVLEHIEAGEPYADYNF